MARQIFCFRGLALWLLLFLLAWHLLGSVAAQEPIILPPSPATQDPDSFSDPDPPPVLLVPHQATSFPQSPVPLEPPSSQQPPLPLFPMPLTPSEPSSPSQPPTPSTSTSLSLSPLLTPSARPPPPSNNNRGSNNNKAAASLKLVHVPLKVSCEILRQFYNKTGGYNWSNQDGWQFVDSVSVPPVNPPTIVAGGAAYLAPDGNLPGPPPLGKSLPSPVLQSVAAPTSVAGDNSATDPPVGSPINPPSPYPPTTNLDPNNCCGWYGVVCIGPDGVIPPPWTPYDDDLVSNRVSAAPSSESGIAPPILPRRRKRSGSGVPYYNYHDRNQHRHAGDGGQGHGRSGGIQHGHGGQGGGWRGGTGGSDNRHQPDDGNNEGGRPSDSFDGSNGGDGSGVGEGDRRGDSGNNGGDDRDDEGSNTAPSIPLPEPAYGGVGGARGPQVDDWYIIELHLGFNGLTGPVPEELSGLVNLMILDISNNELTGQIPESYGNLTRLKRLDISSNQIIGAFPVSITRMASMQELVLRNNYLTGSLPTEILKLKQLTELSIANNEFDGMLPPGLFSSLTKLRVVNMNQNGFQGEIDAEVGSLVGLMKFSARANEFKGRIPKEIGNCRQLLSINLSDNHLMGEIPESVYGLQNLRVLDLTDNRLTGRLSPKIGSMLSLTRLILSHNEFNGPLPVEIQNLTRLEYMVLNYNNFDGMFPIAEAPPLITVCMVQPNGFSACPPNASMETSTTLAYQCNLDCRDRVIHPEMYDAASQARSRPRPDLGLMVLGWNIILFLTATVARQWV